MRNPHGSLTSETKAKHNNKTVGVPRQRSCVMRCCAQFSHNPPLGSCELLMWTKVGGNFANSSTNSAITLSNSVITKFDRGISCEIVQRGCHAISAMKFASLHKSLCKPRMITQLCRKPHTHDNDWTVPTTHHAITQPPCTQRYAYIPALQPLSHSAQTHQ